MNQNHSNNTNKILDEEANYILFKLYSDFIKKNVCLCLGIFILIITLTYIEVVELPNKYGEVPNAFTKTLKQSNIQSNTKKTSAITKIMIYITIGWFVITTFNYIVEIFEEKLKPKMHQYIKNLLVRDLFKNKEKDIDNGEYVSRINRILDDVTSVFIELIEKIIPFIIQTLIIIIYSYFIEPLIGVVLTIGFILSVIIMVIKSKEIIRRANVESSGYHEIAVELNDVVSNMENILLNNETEKYNKNINSTQVKYGKKLVDVMQINRDTTYAINVLTVFTGFISLCILFKNNLNKQKISISKISGLVIMLAYYVDGMSKLSFRFPYFLLNYGKICDSTSYFDIKDIDPPKNRKHIYEHFDTNNSTIQFKNITITRGKKNIFENFNLLIPHKQKLAIFGRSGRGKSTLLKSIMGIVHPTKGEILISNKNIENHDLNVLRKNIVYIGQDTVLLNKNVLKNIQEGNNADEKTVINLLDKYNLTKVFQNGVETMVEQNGSNLSKGMQKVIFMIRGLLRNGSVYLLDEPTTALDHGTKIKIINMIRDICHDKTVICISHDPDIKKIMDKSIEL